MKFSGGLARNVNDLREFSTVLGTYSRLNVCSFWTPAIIKLLGRCVLDLSNCVWVNEALRVHPKRPCIAELLTYAQL